MTNLLNTIKETAKNIIKGDISMRYNKDSQTVISWADTIEAGKKALKDVPTFLGLRKVVAEVLEERAKAKELPGQTAVAESSEEVG